MIDVSQAIGSHNGKIYLFDLKGNELRRVKAHTASISDLSLDKTSEYLASASIDGTVTLWKSFLLVGKVIVQGLEVKETQVMDFRRPVRCVVLDPEYAKSSSRRVVSGGMAGQLILSEKGTYRTSTWVDSRMVWQFRDDVTFWRGSNIRYFLERTIHCMD